MRLILNGINGQYPEEINLNAVVQTEYVEAAVAYATDERLLFEWCWDNQIPLRFWGRFDDSIPVNPRILRSFLNRQSPNFTCKLLTHFHAKVIWWHGVGAYVGSANFTDSAWHGNIEAGCFFEEAEMEASGTDLQLRSFFRQIDQHSTILSEELLKAIENRAKELQRINEQDGKNRSNFLVIPSIHQWKGLLRESHKSASEKQRQTFLDEWFSTLQILRDIGVRISKDENRPKWIPKGTPSGAQADQFLHAHYYNNVFEGQRSLFEEQFEENQNNAEGALLRSINWWRNLEEPPSGEEKTLLESAPRLQRLLARENILKLTNVDFEDTCMHVWSVRDHAKRVANSVLGLSGGQSYERDFKTKELAAFFLRQKSSNDSNVLQVIHYVLYGGSDDDLPSRLWEATNGDEWRIDHLGISALGELVGWAMPDRFPPRNKRTSKSLRSLGFQVTVH
jgi:hypothetical protein